VHTPFDSLQQDRRLMAFSAAAIYASGALIDLVEAFIPGGPAFSFAPGLAAFAIVTPLVWTGPRLPRWALAPLGPLGVALIAVALGTSPGPGDGAVLYMWPVLWTAFFFGRPGAVAIVASVGVAHGVALYALPGADGYYDRWVDVMVSVSVVAAVVQVLARRNEVLLARVAAEARTDKLTGLLNRRGFDEHATLMLAQARRDDHPVAVASFDLDHFKHVNDEWGHDVGDKVLARFASTLQAQSRDVDVVARIGGEEFVVLLPGGDVAAGYAFTQRVRRDLVDGDGSELPAVQASAGVAAGTPASIELLLQQADFALYQAKREGRNRTVAYDEPVPGLATV
jgi:diguanylate cyclase (GGDEF)-like protein